MNIGIYYKKNKIPNETVVFELKEKLEEKGCTVSVFLDAKGIAGVDRLLVLGGDGTILRAAYNCSREKIPIVGINYGTLGFLTEFERDERMKSVDLISDPNACKIDHTMIAVKFNDRTIHCLNEMMLSCSAAGSRVATITVMIDGSRAGDFRADGLIVATPTGSTAYSLSAGGSIMVPACKTFMLTPVCAFSLKSRPIAYPDESELTFSLDGNKNPLSLYCDGKFIGNVRSNDTVSVKKSERVVTFLTRNKNSFYSRLTNKIGF